MVCLIAVAETLQNGEGILGGGLTYGDGLETTLESGVLFNILAVFIQRSCTDDPNLAAGEGGL